MELVPYILAICIAFILGIIVGRFFHKRAISHGIIGNMEIIQGVNGRLIPYLALNRDILPELKTGDKVTMAVKWIRE